MYNMHRGKHSNNPSNGPQNQSRRRLTPEEEAKIREKAQFAQNLLIAFFEIKELEKKISNKCLDSCLTFEESALEDNERECLKNCASKITPFMKLAKNILKENDQNLTDLEEKYMRSEAFLNPENFLKH